jgi:hypothetical protein
MNNRDKLIKTLNSQNIFKDLYEMGFTQSDIKKQIIEVLSPYFRNENNLKKNAINFLVADFINLIKVKDKYGDIDKEVKLILETYYNAENTDKILLFDSLKILIPDTIEAGNKFWSFLNLEKDKSELEIYEFVKASLDDISNIIEGLMKYHIIELVVLNRIIKRKSFEISKIKETKLGILLDELINIPPLAVLFKTKPDNLKFTDWRNISAHQDYKIESDQITFYYGIGANRKEISMIKEELFEKVKQIMRTMEILNLAHKFYSFDNINSLIIKHDETAPINVGRDEIWLLMFTTALNSLGFEIADFNYEKNKEAILVLRDITEQDKTKRGIHSSQFSMPIWMGTQAKEITIEYRLKNDSLYLTSKVSGQICKSVAKGEKPISYLAENMDFKINNAS